MFNFSSVMNIPGGDQVLGLNFSTKGISLRNCSREIHLFACCGSYAFCTVDGYQDTVFALLSDQYLNVCPLAYDFREFLRLILACGSASRAAQLGFSLQNDSEMELADVSRRDSNMLELSRLLSLTPIEDPISYLQTIIQVIDISGVLSR